jgi:hypothetical protein
MHFQLLGTYIHVILKAIVDMVPDSEDEPTEGCDMDEAVEDEVNMGSGDDFVPGSEDEPTGSKVMPVMAVEVKVAKKGKEKEKPTKVVAVKSHKKPVKLVKEKAKGKAAEGLEDKKKAKMVFREQLMVRRTDIEVDKNSAAKRKHSATETLYVSLQCYAEVANTPLTKSPSTMHPCV